MSDEITVVKRTMKKDHKGRNHRNGYKVLKRIRGNAATRDYSLKQPKNVVVYNTNVAKGALRTKKLLPNEYNIFGLATPVGYSEVMTACPDYASFLNIYSEYRINKLTYTFRWNPANTSNVSGPVFWVVKRPNSSLIPATLAAMCELRYLSKICLTRDNPTYTMSVIPFNVTDVFVSGLVNGYQKSHKYLELTASSAGIPYYSIFTEIEAITTGDNISIDVEYDVSFRSPK